MEVTRAQVLAYRVGAQHLAARLPGSPPGIAAALALGLRATVAAGPGAAVAARVEGAGNAVLDTLAADRTIADVMGMRASPHLALAADWAVHTAASLPDGDPSLAVALDGLRRRGDPFARLTPTQAVALATDAAREALAAGPLERGALSAAMTRLLPSELSPYCAGCRTEHVGETLFRLAGAAGGYVRRLGERGRARYCLPQDWFDAATPAPRADELPEEELRAAQHELTRRFLHAHGPSDPRGLATWLDVFADDAAARWQAFPDPLAEVELEGRRQWILAADVDALVADVPAGTSASGSTPADVVRLLPPYDPLLLTPDRATLVPEAGERKLLWRALGNPGVVLLRGEVAGTWRAAASGRRLTVTITPLAAWDPGALTSVETEAELLAQARGTAFGGVVVGA